MPDSHEEVLLQYSAFETPTNGLAVGRLCCNYNPDPTETPSLY